MTYKQSKIDKFFNRVLGLLGVLLAALYILALTVSGGLSPDSEFLNAWVAFCEVMVFGVLLPAFIFVNSIVMLVTGKGK